MLKPCLVSVLALLAGLAPATGQETRYTFLFSGNKAGSLVTRVQPDGERICTFEFNDRGRGPKTETRFRLGPGGIPVSEHTTGVDYWKTPVDERFERTGAKASWKNAAENGERQLTGPAFYLGLNAPPQEFELLTKALLAAPGGRLPLLPVGEAHVAKLDSRKVSAGGKERTADLYAVYGLGFSPSYEWLDAQHNLFAGISGWAAVIPEGWEDDGLLNLAAGVTTVRDMANDVDKLRDLKRRWESGEAVGPRVLMAGFMDGPGPFAGPTKVLVSTEKEALDWVDRYAAMGYVQIKLYSSLDPKLVPAIVKRAHEKGLRVSGHIPNGMTAEEAVRAGFDEIQHVNFLVLNFLDRGIDTRSTGRFTEVGQHAAEPDLNSDQAKSFIALLKDRGTDSDPPLATFEALHMAAATPRGRTYA